MTRLPAIISMTVLVACSGEPKPTKAVPPAATLSRLDAGNLASCRARLLDAAEQNTHIGVLELVDVCLPACDPRETAPATARECGIGGAPSDVKLVEASLAWIESMRAREGSRELSAGIDQALEQLVVTLSIPASRAGVPRSELLPRTPPRVFVRLADREMFVGAAPAATLTGARVGMLPRPFPGAPTTRSELLGAWSALSSRLEEQQDVSPTEPDNDDDDDVSASTGTKMALDEGKMGTKEGSRKSGQYAMKDDKVPPELAQKAAIDAARRSGVLGLIASTSPPLVIADAKASASPVAAVTSVFGRAVLAVERDGELGAHAVELVGHGTTGSVFIEIVEQRIEVSGEPGARIPAAKDGPDFAALADHLEKNDVADDVVLLVSVETRTDALAAVLDILGRLGATSVGVFGGDPSLARANLTSLTATGDLDIKIIRRYVERFLPQSTACYAQELQADPTLSGVVDVDFVITPTGKTLQVAAKHRGLDDAISTCVETAFKGIHFPRPRGGGMATVKASVRLSY